MMTTALIVAAIFVGVCAWLDWKCREIPNRLTFAFIAAALIFRLAGFAAGSWLPALGIGTLAFAMQWSGWIGGADAKLLVALALLDPRLALWAWLGATLWWLVARLYLALLDRSAERFHLPGVMGFLAGTALYALILGRSL